MKKLAIFGLILLMVTWIGMAVWITMDCNRQSKKIVDMSELSEAKSTTVPVRMDMEMVRIPAGIFLMGTDGNGDSAPAHSVRLQGYEMDKTEVTCAQYLRFCQQTGHQLPFFWERKGFFCGPDFPNHPVIGVSWADANAYAKWLGKRLPTEAEWEYAARGGLVNQSFPNGNTLSLESGNYNKSGKQGTVPVGSYAPNGFGLHDMLGNVLEWVSDRYGAEYYRKSPVENPLGPKAGRFRVVRGGGWKSGPGCVAVFHRNALPANWVDFNVGFRCVRSLPASTEVSSGSSN